MKKVLIGSTLALGLFFVGISQSSASTIQGTEAPHVNMSSFDIESVSLMLRDQRVKVLENQMGVLLADIQKARENASLSNTRQMDMLRIQNLINQRNQLLDIMSDTTKKMQDSRTSIIENKR